MVGQGVILAEHEWSRLQKQSEKDVGAACLLFSISFRAPAHGTMLSTFRVGLPTTFILVQKHHHMPRVGLLTDSRSCQAENINRHAELGNTDV